jgi:hypothetical protein
VFGKKVSLRTTSLRDVVKNNGRIIIGRHKN